MRDKQDTVPALLRRLQKWFARHRRRYLKGLRPGASAAELDDLACRIGRPLPDDLRALLAWHDGQGDDFTGAFEQSWSLMSCQRIAEAYAELAGDSDSGWQSGWIPFLEDFRDHYVFVDDTQAPAPVRVYRNPDREPATAAPSLAAWLHEFVAAVEAGRYVQDPERGDFLRQSR